jgi:hypothetical protein
LFPVDVINSNNNMLNICLQTQSHVLWQLNTFRFTYKAPQKQRWSGVHYSSLLLISCPFIPYSVVWFLLQLTFLFYFSSFFPLLLPYYFTFSFRLLHQLIWHVPKIAKSIVTFFVSVRLSVCRFVL